MSLTDLDIFVADRAHDVWTALRAGDPVSWNDGTALYPGFWSIVKYDDVVAVSLDTGRFVSRHGITLMGDPRRQTAPSGADKMLLTMDAPRHGKMRALVSAAFSARRIAGLEPAVRASARRLIGEARAAGRCDFVAQVAARLPLEVICTLIGIPREEWERMSQLSDHVLGADDPEHTTRARSGSVARWATAFGLSLPDDAGSVAAVVVARRAQHAMFGVFARLLAERRRSARDDLVSLLAGAEIGGEPLGDDDLLHFCYLLMLTGNETTRNAIAGGLFALLSHPDQRELLLRQPEPLAPAVEEILRWTSPVLHMARVAEHDCEVRGRRIRAGDRVVMWYPSANRDEDAFAEPHRFDVRRTPNDHVAFGTGPHFCLGAALARLELRVVLEELLPYLGDMELAGELTRLRSAFIGGIKTMPVSFLDR